MSDDDPTGSPWERLRRGDREGREAFDDLMRPHLPWLGRYLLYLLGDPGIADDALQEVLVRAHARLGDLRDPAALRGWLRRIATHTAFNLRRTERRFRERHERAAAEAPVRFAPATAETAELRDAIVAVLQALPYPYREILVLRYVEEMTVREVATHLGIQESAAKMRLARARRAFQARWSEEVHDVPR